MRVLHSSDWHLGQHFMGKSREPEHQAFFDWLLQQIQQHQVDALIVAGDIFDTSSPPSYARRLYSQFVVDMQKTGCQLIVLGGNHDSVAVLHESKALLECLGTMVIGGALESIADQVITLNTRKDEIGAVLCAVPFLRPRDLMESQAGLSGDEKQYQLLAAMRDHYQRIYQQAVSVRNELDLSEQVPIIATGHLTTVGGKSSDSVRDIYIGTLDAFPASEFPPADYIALGHLHRAQKVAGCDHIRYCGSPIPLSFDESGRGKEVLLAEFESCQLKQVVSIEVPCFQKLAVLRGRLEQIPNQLKQLFTVDEPAAQSQVEMVQQVSLFDDLPDDIPSQDSDSGDETELTETGQQSIWLEIEIETDDYLTDLQARIEELIGDYPVEVLRIKRARRKISTGLNVQLNETLSELSVADVFLRRMSDEQLEPSELNQLQVLFEQVVSDVEAGDAEPEGSSSNAELTTEINA